MIFWLWLIFVALAAVSAGFVAWPILRARGLQPNARLTLAAAATLIVAGIGGGLYLELGKPALAMRSLTGPKAEDFNSLVTSLAWTVRQRPDDLKAWSLLWPAYIELKDPRDAAGAFRHAIVLAPPNLRPGMYADYGEALSVAAGGITDDSEAAFKTALSLDPNNPEARYYMGYDYAARGDNAKALATWQGLLAEIPPNSALHGILVDHIARLTAASGTAPNIAAMVEGLAQRLQTNPDNPEGWQRLIRAYAVLGDVAKARAALSDARIALRAEQSSLTALDAEAKDLKLEK